MVRPRVFFDFTINDVPAGRVVFELFNDEAPKTCENFRALCTGEQGLPPLRQQPWSYKNTVIHRSIKGFMIQGGDFTKRNGTGGESIWGGLFQDEVLVRALDSCGLLCMANRGPDTNGSQFFITLKSCPHLNGKHVVFGRVASGYEEVIKKIADVHVDHKDRPTVPVVIVNCGELELRTRKVDGARSALHNDRLEQTSAKEAKHGKRKISAPNREDRGQHRNPSPSLPSDVPRKRKNNIDYSGSHAKSPVLSDSPPRREMHLHETEEEYDARLEREEVERLTAERKSKLQKLRNVDEDMQISKGVRFKGRGRMQFKDPELYEKIRADSSSRR